MRYRSAASFRQALEQRLKTRAAGNEASLVRDRKRVAFDRLLARLAATAPDRWLLEGGFALDLRLAERARATRDVDIEWHALKDELLDALIDAVERDASDHFTFEIERAAIPEDRLGGAHRFRVSAALAGRFFEAFVLDVGFRATPVAETDTLTTPDLLAFAGIEPVTVGAVPLARMSPRSCTPTRRSTTGGRTHGPRTSSTSCSSPSSAIDAAQLHAALSETFSNRATHGPPTSLPSPPAVWRLSFRALADAVGITPNLDEGRAAAAALLDPVLDGRVTQGSWTPTTQAWSQQQFGQRVADGDGEG